MTDRVGARGHQTGDSGAAGSPGSRGGSSDHPRDPSPTPRTGASPSSVTPPASCRSRYEAERQPRAVSHRITTWPGPDCGGGCRAEQRGREDHEHGGAAPAAAGCLPGPLMACLLVPGRPAAVADPAGEPVDGAGARPLDAATSLGDRRHRPRREEYRVQAAVLARRAPGGSGRFRKSESPRRRPGMQGGQERCSGWGGVPGVVVGCLPAGGAPGCAGAKMAKLLRPRGRAADTRPCDRR
jgi:hypothetical protein